MHRASRVSSKDKKPNNETTKPSSLQYFVSQQEKPKTSWNLHRNNNSISNSQMLDNVEKNNYNSNAYLSGNKRLNSNVGANIYSSVNIYNQSEPKVSKYSSGQFSSSSITKDKIAALAQFSKNRKPTTSYVSNTKVGSDKNIIKTRQNLNIDLYKPNPINAFEVNRNQIKQDAKHLLETANEIKAKQIRHLLNEMQGWENSLVNVTSQFTEIKFHTDKILEIDTNFTMIQKACLKKVDDDMVLILNNLKNEINSHNMEKADIIDGKESLEVDCNKNLEVKSMTAEDFSGKLMQRAELIAEREEIEQKNKQIELCYTSELEILDNHIDLTEKVNDLERDQLLRKRRIKKYQKIIDRYVENIRIVDSEILSESLHVDAESKNVNQESITLRIDLQSLEEKMEESFKQKGWENVWEIIKENYEGFGTRIELNNLKAQRCLAYNQIEEFVQTFDKHFNELTCEVIEKENLMVDGESDENFGVAIDDLKSYYDKKLQQMKHWLASVEKLLVQSQVNLEELNIYNKQAAIDEFIAENKDDDLTIKLILKGLDQSQDRILA